MNTVNELYASNVADESPSNNRDFNDASKNMWRDNLNFNIFDVAGYLTDEAKAFIKDKEIVRKSFNETWGDAILNYAERYELGYQVSKSPKKRSDVKFSGSMILSAYLEAEEQGRDFRERKVEGKFEEGIDLIEILTVKSYQ